MLGSQQLAGDSIFVLNLHALVANQLLGFRPRLVGLFAFLQGDRLVEIDLQRLTGQLAALLLGLNAALEGGVVVLEEHLLVPDDFQRDGAV